MAGKVIWSIFSLECFCTLAKWKRQQRGLSVALTSCWVKHFPQLPHSFFIPIESLYLSFLLLSLSGPVSRCVSLSLNVSVRWSLSVSLIRIPSSSSPSPTVPRGTGLWDGEAGRLGSSWKQQHLSPRPLACLFETLTTWHILLSKVSVELFM